MSKPTGIMVSIFCFSMILAGCGGGGGGGTPTPANDPPAAVTLSNLSEASMSSLYLSWTQSEEADFASYKLYRSTSSGVSQSSTLVTTIRSKTTTIATASGLSASTKYYFKVYVCVPSDSGGECTGSNEVNGTTTSGGPPSDIEWITIPAGDFVMGCNIGVESCSSWESPKHTVTLSEYKIQKYEVTNAQYKACVDAAVCAAPSNSKSYTRSSYYGNATYYNYPVIYVDWSQARTYCNWIRGRLPTEAEWEKAARGPSPREVIYTWGNSSPTCALANYDPSGTGSSSCVGDTNAVGSYPTGASYYGAMDMAGNVDEWVNDWYDYNYYTTGGPPWSNPHGPSNGSDRVSRGGSWGNKAKYIRASYREGFNPTYTQDHIGFRCAQ